MKAIETKKSLRKTAASFVIAAMIVAVTAAAPLPELTTHNKKVTIEATPSKANALNNPLFDYYAGVNVFPFPCLCTFSYLIPVVGTTKKKGSGIYVWWPFFSALYSFHDIFTPFTNVTGSAIPTKEECGIYLILFCLDIPGKPIWQIGTSP